MEYFAIRADVDELMDLVTKYYQRLYAMGLTQKIQRSHYMYFGQNGKTSRIQSAGDEGERHDVSVNDYNSLIRHVITLVTANRRSFKARAVNTDYQSQVQSVLLY